MELRRHIVVAVGEAPSVPPKEGEGQRPYLCAFTIGVQSYDEVSEKPNIFEN